jgi:hypothetical protein
MMKNFFGQRVLMYVDRYGKVHQHYPATSALSELPIAPTSKVLYLRNGGWLRRCRVANQDNETDSHWKVSAWKANGEVYLTDTIGGVLVASPLQALAIVNRFTSVYDVLRDWRSHCEHIQRLNCEVTGEAAKWEKLLVALVQLLDAELTSHKQTKSKAAARLREAVTKVLVDWVRSEHIVLTEAMLVGVSQDFVREWHRTGEPSRATAASGSTASPECEPGCCGDH